MNLLRLFPPPEYLMMRGVGIDISDRSLKFVEFEKRKEGLRLKKFGEEILEEGVIENGEIKKKDKMISFLKKIKKIHKFFYVILSLPEEKVFVSLVELPIMPAEQIKTSLSFQIEEYIPLKKENVIFDFEVTPSLVKTDHLDILLLAFPRKLVLDYYEVFEKAGLFPLVMELESLSLARGLVPEDNKENIIVVDFGRTRTSFAILRGSSLRFTSTIALGGRDMEKIIAKTLGINLYKAEEIKKTFSLIGPGREERVYEAILPILSSLKDEIEKYQLYWQSHPLHFQAESKPGIKEIILVGGDANLKGLPEYLSQELSLPVKIGNPWTKVASFDEYVPEITKRESLAYSIAIGLALRGLWGE